MIRILAARWEWSRELHETVFTVVTCMATRLLVGVVQANDFLIEQLGGLSGLIGPP